MSRAGGGQVGSREGHRPRGRRRRAAQLSHHKPVPRPLRRCWNSERKPEPEAGGFNQEKEDTEFSGKAFGHNTREARPTQAKLSFVLKKKSRLLTFKFVMV